MLKHIHAAHILHNVNNIPNIKKEGFVINDIISTSGFDDLAASCCSVASRDQLLRNKINAIYKKKKKSDFLKFKSDFLKINLYIYI